MIKLNHSRLIGFLILCCIILLANTFNPPNGRTGAPGESTCASGCHSGNNSSLDGSMTLSGLPATIQSNTTYTITVTVDNPNGAGVKGGFQWVALNASNQSVGTMSNSDSSSGTVTSGGRTYHEHGPAQNFNSSNETNYTVEWTSPAGPNNETITFYGCAVISNGAGGNSGDRVTLTNTSGTLMSSATPPTLNVSLINNVLCANGNDGSAIAMGSGGTPSYSYAWDNGENTATAQNLDSGLHTVTVTDSAMNTAEASIMISEPTAISPALVSSNNEDCIAQNGSAQVTGTGGTPSYSYLWPDGSMDAMNNNLSSGSYLVTVIDGNQCSETINVTIGNNPTAVTITLIDQTHPLCNGAANGNITVSGSNGTSPYSYMWSDGSTMATNSNLAAGTYIVTVSDNFGCTATESYTLTDPTSLSLSLNGDDLMCYSDSSGSVEAAISGGSGSYNYLWSDGSASSSISNLSAGTYYCTVSDANNCEIIDSIIILQPDSLMANLSSTVTAPGGNTGTASTLPSGGVAPYSPLWSTGSTDNSINNLGVGTYTITLTDDNNCTTIDSIIILDTNCTLTAFHSVDMISCNGLADGSIMLSPSNGNGTLTYLWSTGQDSQNLNNLSAGFYSVTVTDSNMCTAEINDIEITQPEPLSLSPDIISLPGCNGEEFGVITVNTTGGTSPYFYDWSLGFSSDTINVSSGMYTVTITDSNDCTGSTEVNVNSTDNTPPTLLVADITVYIDNDGNTGPITSDMFDQGSFDDCQLDEFIFDSSNLDCNDREKSLPIELRDINGNTSLDTILITVLDSIDPEIICPGDITLSACGPSQYTLPVSTDNCMVTAALISGPTPDAELPIGIYEVTYMATDEFGNTASCSFNMTVDPEIEYTVVTTDVSCFNFQDGTFSLEDVSGNNSPLTFLLNSNPQFLEAGEYEFTLTDGSGCELIDSFEIFEPPVLLISDFQITNSTDSNSMDGAIEITPTGGVPDYSFEWFTNGMLISTNQNIDNLNPGFYTCIITDDAGCIYQSIEFEVPATTSNNDLVSNDSFKIYPNPVNNILLIDNQNNELEVISYRLMDIQGRSHIEIFNPSTSTQIDVNDYNPGIYILEVALKDQSFYKKVMVH